MLIFIFIFRVLMELGLSNAHATVPPLRDLAAIQQAEIITRLIEEGNREQVVELMGWMHEELQFEVFSKLPQSALLQWNRWFPKSSLSQKYWKQVFYRPSFLSKHQWGATLEFIRNQVFHLDTQSIPHTLQDGDLDYLGDPEFCSPYISIRLDNQKVSGDAILRFLKSPCSSSLKELSLVNSQLDDSAILEFLAQPHFLQLERLNLAANSLTVQSLNSIGASALSRGIIHLNLSGTRIDDQGLSQMSPIVFEKLEKLYLSGNHISLEGLNHLLDQGQFRNLTHLYLINCFIWGTLPQSVRENPILRSLVELRLEQDHPY